jgi:hypothetical protein
MRILKGFKSFVLKLRILRGLRARFAEMRILKSLEKKTKRGKICGAEATAQRGPEEELRSEEKSGEAAEDWLETEVNIGKSSIALATR